MSEGNQGDGGQGDGGQGTGTQQQPGSGGQGGGSRGSGSGGGDRELLTENIELRKQLEQATKLAGQVPDLTTKIEQLTGDLDGLRTRHAEDLALTRVGLTDGEAQAVARTLFNRIPDKERPEGGFSAWVEGLTGEGAAVPKALQGYLGGGEAGGTGGTGGGTGKGGQGGGSVGSGKPVTEAALRAARQKALQTGNWTEFEKLAAAVQADRT